MVVEPGDLILGDEDGLLSVPYAEVEEIYLKASAKHAAEQKQLEQIAVGENDRSWVINSLKQKDVNYPNKVIQTIQTERELAKSMIELR